MKKIMFLTALVLALTAVAFGQATPTPSPRPAPTPAPYDKLKVGDMAPDFTLTDTKGVKVKLSDFRGKNNVVLAFYVFAFTGG
jgi:cytochrome oxidase Cu insertion factor (SCO1/SenC/PrrC family)